MATTVLTAKFDFSQPKSAAKQTAAQMEQLKNKAKGAQGQLDNASKSAKGAGVASAFLGKASAGAVPGVAALGTALKAALGPIALLTSAAGVLTSAFSTLAQQDFAEAKVRTLGVNSEELKGRLSAVSRELAGQASVVELTAAAYDVASAGFNDAASASQVLKASSLAATGGFSDLNTVADATTSVLNAYGLGAEEATRITDQFIQTQNDGKIVIGQYAANIAKVAPVASALGIGLDEVNAAVAQITGTGTGAEVTFTALKTAFAQLASGGVGEKLKEFGVTIDANTIAADGFVGTLKKIRDSGADTGAILKAFGTEAGPVLQPLLNDFDKLNKLVENQRNAQGAAAKAAFEAGDTINGALKRLQTSFTNLFADGSELGLLLKGTFQVAAVTVEVFTAAVKLLLAPIRGGAQGIARFFEAMSPFGENINLAYELEKGFQSVMGGIDFATKAITGFFSVLSEGLYTGIGNVLNFVNSIREGIAGIFSGLGQVIKDTLTAAYDNLPEPIQFIIKQAGAGFQSVGNFLGGMVSGVTEKLTGVATEVTTAVGGTVQELAKIGGAVQGGGTQPVTAQNAIQPTNNLLGGGVSGGTKPTKDEEAERLARIAKAHADDIRALEQKTLLASALNKEEKQKFQRQIEIAEILRNEVGLNEQQLKAKLDATTALHEQQDATQALIEANKERLEQEKEVAEKGKAIADLYTGIGDSIKSGVTDAIKGAIDGTKSLGEAASSILSNIGDQLISFGINSIFGGLGGGGGILGSLFGGGRANGGTVQGGRSYVVGERGPELFTPGRTGSVAPNSAMGGNISVNVNVDASGSAVQGDGNEGAQLGKAIGAAVQQELMKQKRPGGLLAGV